MQIEMLYLYTPRTLKPIPNTTKQHRNKTLTTPTTHTLRLLVSERQMSGSPQVTISPSRRSAAKERLEPRNWTTSVLVVGSGVIACGGPRTVRLKNVYANILCTCSLIISTRVSANNTSVSGIYGEVSLGKQMPD